MRSLLLATMAGALAFATLVPVRSAHAHATYNLAGYTAGLAGSTNGADGSPTNDATQFTNGPIDGYAGGLPAHWYAGMHNATTVRTLQTGVDPTPASGSMLAQVNAYNTDNDPDLPTDRVLAVGGLSWTDPSNDNQGWGHGLDYGLVHFSPLDTLLAGGGFTFTITLADDPSDAVTPQLAFAIYGGWDTNPGSVRHQTFVTNPSPVDNPLGSTGLTFMDAAVAATPGETLERTYTLDTTYDGHYTIFVAALGGVAGQYQLTVTPIQDSDGDTIPNASDNCPFDANLDQLDTDADTLGDVCDPFPNEPNNDLAQCLTDLADVTADHDACHEELEGAEEDLVAAQAALDAATVDTDGDGSRDADDACPDTTAGADVDRSGCSLEQFCGGVDATTKSGQKICKKTDWKNDEALMKKKEGDCTVDKGAKGADDDRCVAAS
jgi:hypothetical protein